LADASANPGRQRTLGAGVNTERIIVPLGMRSEWARIVVAAGHCRRLLHDQVLDLDEPAMVDAGEARDLSLGSCRSGYEPVTPAA